MEDEADRPKDGKFQKNYFFKFTNVVLNIYRIHSSLHFNKS